MVFTNINQFEKAAREKLDQVVYDYYAGGSSGVQQALSLIIDEFRAAMILCGCRNVADISADLLLS